MRLLSILGLLEAWKPTLNNSFDHKQYRVFSCIYGDITHLCNGPGAPIRYEFSPIFIATFDISCS